MLTYGQKTSQDVSYMTSWDETALEYDTKEYADVIEYAALLYKKKTTTNG